MKLTVFAWSALFCTLGYNFLAYSFLPADKGGGVAYGWLICGILFEFMGGIPLLLIIKESIRYYRQRNYRRSLRKEAIYAPKSSGEKYLPEGWISFLVFIINVGGIAAGIYLGASYFRTLTG